MQIACDDSIADGNTRENRHGIAIARTERHYSLFDLVTFAHDVEVFAKLARSDRRLREGIGEFSNMQADADILTGK